MNQTQAEIDDEEDLGTATHEGGAVSAGQSAAGKAKRWFWIFCGGSLVAFIVIWQVVMAVSTAKSQSSTTVSGQKGSGAVVVSARSVSEAAVDSTVSVPDGSPLASQAKAREDAELKAARESGGSYIPRVRVQPKDEPQSAEVSADVPSPTKVDERGQEVAAASANASKNQPEEKESQARDSLAGQAPRSTSKPNNQDRSEVELAADLRKEEMRRKLMDLERQRLQAKKALLQENAKILFSGSPHVPPAKSWFKEPPADPAYYQTGVVIAPMEITAMERGGTASSLYRRDGATTLFGAGHPGVTSTQNAKASQPQSASTTSAAAYPRSGSAITSGAAPEQGQASVNRDALRNRAGKDEKVISLGQLVYAHLTLPMNSDVPGPIRIKIDQGKLKGGIALGNFQILNHGVGAGLRINVISHQDKLYRVNAWAVSPDTELYAFDQDIDHHYFSRFAGLAAGGFLTGFLSSLVDAATTTDGGSTTSTSSRIEGNKDRMIYSLGNAANAFMPIFYDIAKRPVTVRVPKGQEMALLFLDDVFEPGSKSQLEAEQNKKSNGSNEQAPQGGNPTVSKTGDPLLAVSDAMYVSGVVAGKAGK